MDEPKAVNTPATAAPQTETPAVETDDAESRIALLESEKAKIEEERDNWKTAALKFKGKAKGELTDEEDEERMAQIAKRTLAESRLAEIVKEQDDLIKKTLKENKELKLAHNNKPSFTPSSGGGSGMGVPVKDTIVSAEQMNYFKTVLKWDDATIERYKKNLSRQAR